MKRNFPPESFQIRAALSQSLRQLWSGKNHLIKIYPRASAKTIVVSLRTECIEQKMERNLSESFRLLLIAIRGRSTLIVQDLNLEFLFFNSLA